MNVKIGTLTGQFLFWAYSFQIFGIGSLQCNEAQHGGPESDRAGVILYVMEFPAAVM
jgi:hypothetical protein